MTGKKLLVLSDTHGSVSELATVLTWAKERMPPKDTIYAAAFLGDGLSDLGSASKISGFYGDWHYIRGNNDFGHSAADSAVFDFAENRFFINHGHRHSLYDNYRTLTAAARNNNANVALFGHTHVPFAKTIDGILLVNPGSVGRPRSRCGSSFAVIECLDKQIKVEFWGISSNGEVFKLVTSIS